MFKTQNLKLIKLSPDAGSGIFKLKKDVSTVCKVVKKKAKKAQKKRTTKKSNKTHVKSSRGELVYEEDGNKLYKKIVTKNITVDGKRVKRKVTQYSAYNREGKMVNTDGLAYMMAKSGIRKGYAWAPVSERGRRIESLIERH